MCRADLRREERKEERRRRRAEGGGSIGSSSTRSTIMSTSSSSSRVPDLVGGHGHGHSRNASTASSRTSYSSTSGLSRNPSVASSSTSRRGYGFNVDTPIMEDDDEAEWLVSESTTGYGLPHPFECNMPPTIRMPVPTIRGHPAFAPGVPQSKRRPSHSHSSSRSQKKKLEPFGMGQDMRDVLEEIISMEKEFIIDSSDEASTHGYTSDTQAQPVFTAVFDRPPRTPSPGMEGNKRISLAPGAPARGHRKSMSMANPPPEVQNAIPYHPPPFIYGHSASLSESHTALYLATASPESSTETRSASPPKMKARNSMTFTPEAAGPVIANASWLGADKTPSRRRPGHSPSAHHPTMSGWKFPNYANFNSNVNANNQSNLATPTKLTIDTQTHNLRTPTSTSQRPHPNTRPQLLWPPNAPALAPSHFPSSAGSRNSIISINMDASDDQLASSPTVQMAQEGQRPQRQRRRQGPTPREVTPPNSGLRLGVLLGSGGSEEGGMDLDEGSPVLGGSGQYVNQHGFGYGFGMGRPVYLSPAPSESGPHFG